MIAIGAGDARYPRGLLDLRDPPDPLWIEGDIATLARRAVSIVGTRRLTPYGARVARELAVACAGAGIVVVSGLAQGIDSAAHGGALEGGGPTVAVLGSGIAAHRAETRGRRRLLTQAVVANGALVSEFPPDAPPRHWTFPRRDATIAALGEVTIVVEAPLDSGALITAAEARRLGRPVYAVPGPIGAAASGGANALIAEGRARALTGVAMLLDVLDLPHTSSARADGDVDARILDALAAAPADPDALAKRLSLTASALASHIAVLVIRGAVTTSPDGRLARR